MPKPELNDILAIFARHINWQDEGDRRDVAEFLDRDADEHDTFGRKVRDDADNTDDANDHDSTIEPNKPADTPKPQPTRGPANAVKRSN